MDPVLKLYKNCPVMFTDNLDVENCKANGTRATVQEIQHNTASDIFELEVDGQKTRAIFASKISSMRLSLTDHNDRTCTIEPKKHRFRTEKPEKPGKQVPVKKQQERKKYKNKLPMMAVQLPVIRNSATTGHKLQGASLNQLVVSSFCYQNNWPYVVMSRVRTRKGLFLREPLDPEKTKTYSVPHQLKEMLAHFRDKNMIQQQTFIRLAKKNERHWKW